MDERDWSVLSGREKQILDLLSLGMSSKETAVRLGLCNRTIDNHCVSIIRKLKVSDRFEAVRLWQRCGE